MKLKLKPTLIALWVLILVPATTAAYYNDTETSSANTFTASTLDTTITNITPSTSLPLLPGLYSGLSFKLNNIGQLSATNLETIKNISNTALGSKVMISILINNTPYVPYTNIPLTSFNMADFLTQNSGQTNTITYVFYISLSNYLNLHLGSSVSFTIENYASQQGIPNGQGFFDKEDINITLHGNPFSTYSTTSTFVNPSDALLNSIDPSL
jgi:predicted ribosomally synthesized peptide with SipW-like signal peptide